MRKEKTCVSISCVCVLSTLSPSRWRWILLDEVRAILGQRAELHAILRLHLSSLVMTVERDLTIDTLMINSMH